MTVGLRAGPQRSPEARRRPRMRGDCRNFVTFGLFRPSRDEIRRPRSASKTREPRRLLGFSEWSSRTRTGDLLGAIQATRTLDFDCFGGFPPRSRLGLPPRFRPVPAVFGWDRAKETGFWPDLGSALARNRRERARPGTT